MPLTAVPPADLPAATGRWYKKRLLNVSGVSGPVYALTGIRGGRSDIEVPQSLLPCSSPYLAYDISIVEPAEDDDDDDDTSEDSESKSMTDEGSWAGAAADGPVSSASLPTATATKFILHAVVPLEIHTRVFKTEGNGVRKTQRVPIKKLADLPRTVSKAARRHAQVALVDDKDFYALLVHYDSKKVLKAPRSSWSKMAALVRIGDPRAYFWAGMAGLLRELPYYPDLESRFPANDPPLRAYRLMRELFLQYASVTFPALGSLLDTQTLTTLQQWGLLTEDCTFAYVKALEKRLLESFQPTHELHHFESWHGDLHEFAQEGDVVLVPDPQTMQDARNCKLDNVYHWRDALGGALGGTVTLLRAERLELGELLKLMTVVDRLRLTGDAQQRLAFPERRPMHGFALLCLRMGCVSHSWPEASWQSGIARQIDSGNPAGIDLLALKSWGHLSRVVAAGDLKSTLILLPNESTRREAMRALNVDASPTANVSFSQPATGRVDRVSRVSAHHAKIFGEEVLCRTLRRADIELYTRCLETRKPKVVCIIDNDTPRGALISALKHAEGGHSQSFKVLMAPGMTTSFRDLRGDYEEVWSAEMQAA